MTVDLPSNYTRKEVKYGRSKKNRFNGDIRGYIR